MRRVTTSRRHLFCLNSAQIDFSQTMKQFVHPIQSEHATIKTPFSRRNKLRSKSTTVRLCLAPRSIYAPSSLKPLDRELLRLTHLNTLSGGMHRVGTSLAVLRRAEDRRQA